MRTYKVSNVFHRVFDDKEELPSGIGVVPDWRQADIGATGWKRMMDVIFRFLGKEQ